MTGLIPSGHTAVMAQRREPPDSLDFFPTPPWATRALARRVLQPRGIDTTLLQVWEPACGEGHMSAALADDFAAVVATDVFDYRGPDLKRWPVGWWRTLDFIEPVAGVGVVTDWIITNPPFKVAERFALRALEETRGGVALLVRSAWLEGTGRYERVFRPHPPAIVAQFAERVPMTKGRWDPDASTATSYAWVVWLKEPIAAEPVFTWIPPGQRSALTMPDDAARFGVRAAAPLLDGGGL